MKKFAFAGVGVAVGFVSALALFPAAHGATNVLSAYRELDLFGDAFERVRANYVREVDDSELINAAINGMVSSLDPHSSYADHEARGVFGGFSVLERRGFWRVEWDGADIAERRMVRDSADNHSNFGIE